MWYEIRMKVNKYYAQSGCYILYYLQRLLLVGITFNGSACRFVVTVS